MKMKMPYSVPPTYFASLQERLGEIPRKSSRPRRGFVFVLGNLAGAVFIVAATLICSELLDRKDSAFNEADAIVEYLIDSGTTLAQIGDVMDNQM